MKKVIIFSILSLLALTLQAQKKVAILETVDKDQNVSYGVKLLLRSSLTTAISNTPGYEGYDRVDMSAIVGEQDFQRTGVVSDSQIKQLGVATGAAYVLVAEAAKYDDKSIIITAKILDVETYGIKKSDVQISGITASEMKQSCNILAASLLEVEADNTSENKAQDEGVNVMDNGLEDAAPLLVKLPDGTSLYIRKGNIKKYGGFAKQEEAANDCSCMGEGWRLPTAQELQSLYENRKNLGVDWGSLGVSIKYGLWTKTKGRYFFKGKMIEWEGRAYYFCVKSK
ncbi:MAG: hypothetical protein J6T88_04810 [Bacteroidales bacterium]|nr:hypothetical protein [Bacteroidales bacterium]